MAGGELPDVRADSVEMLAVREAEWQSETLAGCLAALLANAHVWTAMSMAARRLAVPNAAERIVVDCEALMLGRW